MEEILCDIGGKTVGRIVGNKFVKTGRQAVLFKRHNGFGVAREILDSYDFDWLEVHYDGIVYTVDKPTFMRHGKGINIDGYEPQVVLPKRYWSCHSERQTSLL